MCKHEAFHAHTHIDYLEDTGQFMASIKINCSQCGEEFQFLGMECGLNLNGATVGIDGLEARLALCPKTSKPTPLQRMATGFSVSN